VSLFVSQGNPALARVMNEAINFILSSIALIEVWSSPGGRSDLESLAFLPHVHAVAKRADDLAFIWS